MLPVVIDIFESSFPPNTTQLRWEKRLDEIFIWINELKSGVDRPKTKSFDGI